MEEITKKLLQSCKNDTFLDVVYELDLESRKNEKTLRPLLIRMHNEGQIDVIVEFRKLTRKNTNGDFFLLRYILEEILPSINAPVHQVMDCVKHLSLEAGDDMAAYMLMTPFKDFCRKNPTRSNEVLSIATTDVDDEFDFISPAILSGADLNLEEYTRKTLSLVKNENHFISKRAIFSLGFINYNNQLDLVKIALEVIIASSKTENDEVLSISLRSLFSLFLQEKNCKSILLDFIEKHKDIASDLFVHTALELLSFNKENTPDDIEACLIKFAYQIKPQNKGTISRLDNILSNMLEKREFDKVIIFLEKLFERSNYKISISDFSCLMREICKSDIYLSNLITRWFLSRKAMLGRFCLDLLDMTRDKGVIIKCDISQLSEKYESFHVFLAKKACGWFFSKQISAISFIFSLIDSAPEEQIEEIISITFNPLLISYPGSVKDYLEKSSDSASEKTKNFVTSVLAKLKDYHEGIDQALKINELRPSEAQRHAYNRFHHKIINDVHNEAREKSVFLSIVKESVILYGDSTIYHIHHDNITSRQETLMQKISTRFEFPSLQYIDPHGLDFQVRRFRLEGCM